MEKDGKMSRKMSLGRHPRRLVPPDIFDMMSFQD
jgi:hypothetical protein